jgi:MFS transporter, ACS family, phthalate transporter
MNYVSESSTLPAEHSASLAMIYRKVIMRLLPFFLLSYVINQIDRVNISFAKLKFMQDVGLNEVTYGLGAGLFFVGYVVFELPSNMYLQRVGGKRTFIRIMVLWGLVSCAMAFVQSPLQLYFARFLLGAAEAGFVPGVILYLMSWFPAHYRGRITSMFFIAITFAGILGGPFSGFILGNFASLPPLKEWQWMFVIEGLPAIVLGITAYFYLDDKPEHARWLTPGEKQSLKADLERDAQQSRSAQETSFLKAVRDPRVYICSLAYFAVVSGNNALTMWMPTLIKKLGYSDVVHIVLLSALPYVFGALMMLTVSHHSDRKRERRWHFALPLLASAFAYSIVGFFMGIPWLVISLLAIAAGGIYSAFGVFWTIPPAYLKGSAVAGGIAIISSLGNLGGFVSPIVLGWAAQTGGGQLGYGVIAGIVAAGAMLLVIGLSKQST